MNSTVLLNPLMLIFTSVFFFAFREAIRVAAVWGAFNARNWAQHRTKFPFSIAVLAILPLIAFVLGLQAIRNIRLDPSSPQFGLRSVALVSTLVLAGLFPRACKHVWALLVTYHDRWTNRSSYWEWKRETLPLPVYSFQVLICLGILPALFLSYWTEPTAFASLALNDIEALWIWVYTAQLVVLLHIARERGWMGVDKRPKIIVNRRSLLSLVMLIVLPVWFATVCIAWMNLGFVPGGSWLVRSAVVIGVGFPYCCSSTLFLIARRVGWLSQADNELVGGLPDSYFLVWTLVWFLLLVAGIFGFAARFDLFRQLVEHNSNFFLIPQGQ